MFSGAMLFSPMLLTSKSSNLTVFGMLPAQMQEQFQGVFWLVAAAVAVVVVTLTHAVAMRLSFARRAADAAAQGPAARAARPAGPGHDAREGRAAGLRAVRGGRLHHLVAPDQSGVAGGLYPGRAAAHRPGQQEGFPAEDRLADDLLPAQHWRA